MLNRCLREIFGGRYTSNYLRTFGAIVRAATILADLGEPASRAEARQNIALCCRLVALELGNTPAICKQAYIHPVVFDQYLENGKTIEPLMRKTPRTITATAPAERSEEHTSELQSR